MTVPGSVSRIVSDDCPRKQELSLGSLQICLSQETGAVSRIAREMTVPGFISRIAREMSVPVNRGCL